MNRLMLHVLAAIMALAASAAVAAEAEVVVYKSPTCGCCSKWVDHLKANGFKVTARDVSNLGAIKQKYGVTPELGACHTAVVDGYVVEGHVPAEALKKLLAERPAVKGIAVPGMPMGSPGMEGPRKDPYDVLTFDEQGRTRVYMRK